MKNRIAGILVLCLAVLLAVVAAHPQDNANSAWAAAVAASRDSNRAAWINQLRSSYDILRNAEMKGENLYRAGAMALEIRKFADAENCLKQYVAAGGPSRAQATALLVRARAELRDFRGADAAYADFTAIRNGADAPYELKRSEPARIEALYGIYMARLYEERYADANPLLKQLIDAVGTNAEKWVDPNTLHNYHSWYASYLAENGDPDAAIAFLQKTTYPLFAADPVFEARTRDRILFIKLDRWIATEQYAEGLKELKATVESFKADNTSYRRVSNALKRFSLYNQPAPELDCDALIGKGPRTLKEAGGKVVLLEFFWSGCHPCRQSFPLMKKLAARYADKPFQILGMTFLMGSITPFEGPTVKVKDRADELALLTKYHQDFQLPWPLIVCDDRTNNISYGEMGVPMTVIIDKKGVVRRITTGYDPTLEREIELIDKLLAE